MPNTPNHALPYPDDEDWLQIGAYAIEQLAVRLDAILAENTVATVGLSDTNTVIGTGPANVTFAGAVSRMDGFSFDGVTLTYTGSSPRSFLAAVEVSTSVEGSGGASSSVTLLRNGAALAGSGDHVGTPGSGGNVRRDHTHRITTPVRLTAGDALVVVASTSHAGGYIDSTALRVFPIGAHA